MELRLLVVCALLVAGPFAGCLAGEDQAPAADASAGGGPTLNTTAPDGRGTLVAFEETNQTEAGADGVDHHHDYWQGRERVTIFETAAMMEPFPGGGTQAVFRPPQGTIIFEGTASVEFTLSNPRRHACEPLFTFSSHYLCTDHLVYAEGGVPAVDDPLGGPDGLKIRYKHASTTEWIEAGDVVWGEPLVIKITHPTQTDMPHATSSAWEFEVTSPHDADTTLVFDAKADIVRAEGDNIPLWPGHPLFYTAENPHRVVVDDVEAYACDSGFTFTGCTGVEGEPALVVPDKLISYGTRTLFVWVNITDFKSPSPATAPNSWFLYHYNVTGRENATRTVDAENYPIEGREFFWALPVDDGAMDSPYADGSKWSFGLGASYVPPDNPLIGSCYGGCADWSATYRITVIASSVQLPASEYHMSCLDSQMHCPGEGGEGGEDDGLRAYTRAQLDAMGIRLW